LLGLHKRINRRFAKILYVLKGFLSQVAIDARFIILMLHRFWVIWTVCVILRVVSTFWIWSLREARHC